MKSNGSGRFSAVAVIGALVAIAGLATAAIMFTTGEQALERLGILVAVFASIVPGLIASLRSDQAATQTNGNLDQRIRDGAAAAVQSTLMVQRHSDQALVTSRNPDADSHAPARDAIDLNPDPLAVPE